MNRLEEPLLLSAPLAWRLAPDTCAKDHGTGLNCAWYHALWQYLRVLQINSTPEHYATFFHEAFEPVARSTPQPRILISGAADYSTLAHALWACRAHGATPAFTVLDLCETPLALNRWYAERIDIPVTTVRADILEYRNPGAFDVVCSHAFFGRFQPSRWQALAASWQSLLAPGGAAITVNRVRGAAASELVGFNTEQAQAFRAEVLRRATERQQELGVDPRALADMAEIYAARHRVYPLHSESALRLPFEAAGLLIEHLTVQSSAKTGPSQLGGPTTLEGAGYACLVARKP